MGWRSRTATEATFEEARNCQPSILFFDEIDGECVVWLLIKCTQVAVPISGLAPVRSSKQDQIHASIVSTLLALMDGMDGRGMITLHSYYSRI